MSDLLLIAPSDWEQVTLDGLQRAIDGYGDLNNVKVAVSSGQLAEVSIMIDENRFPAPYTAVEGMFIGDTLWIKSVLTSSL